MGLFDGFGEEQGARKASPDAPLAERMRPRNLDEVLGQETVLGEGRALRQAIEAGRCGSLILWGPPGVGKTTLALLIAEASGLSFEPFSAVLSGVKQVREATERAQRRRRVEQKGTLLFVDEIHRFNKAQQDAFLPHVEQGVFVLIGATTENPSFSVIGALLSRSRVVALQPLSTEAVRSLLDRALIDDERGLGVRGLKFTAEALDRLAMLAEGDARRALTVLEAAAATALDGESLGLDAIAEAFQHRTLAHDRGGDLHFDLLSALHKSLRNSDVQAAVYWLARFLEADADPLQAARRMVAMASEDVGLADPMALQVTMSALHAVQFLGMPEGRLPLTQAAIYLAAAPKSNSVYQAIAGAQQEIAQGAQHPVPMQIRNAPTRVHRDVGAGQGYAYAHDQVDGVAAMECLPDALLGKTFYRPGERGFELKVKERMAEADRLRRSKKG